VEQGQQKMQNDMIRIYQEQTAKGRRVVFIYFPHQAEIDPDCARQLTWSLRTNPVWLDMTRMNREMVAFCNAQKLPLINLVAHLDPGVPVTSLFHPHDQHLNARGYDWAACVVAQNLYQ
jgi:hypothetical protein